MFIYIQSIAMNTDAIVDSENYEDDFDEYEIIDDCDLAPNGEVGLENAVENSHGSISQNFQQTSSCAIGSFSPRGDYDSRMKEIIGRTGYRHERTPGQHKYGGPPPNYKGPIPGPGHEVYVGKLPPCVLEDELIPMFEECGTIYELRLMMKPQSNENKGFAFVTFMDKDSARKACYKFNAFEIRPKQQLKVNVSIPNSRLYIGNIKKSKSKEDIFEEVSKYVEGLREVIVYGQADNPELKNRGFAFLDFDSHKHASEAKKRLSSESFQYFLFNMNCVIEWAEPQEEPSEEDMSKVKVLYVRNLKSNVSQEDVEALFQTYGPLEKVKKVKDFCFVHFLKREDALQALEVLNNKAIKDSIMDITLARPPTNLKVKEKKVLLPLPKGIPGMPQPGQSHVTLPVGKGAPAPTRGGHGAMMGGPQFPLYENFENYEEDYFCNEAGFDYHWGFNHPRPATSMVRGRGSMMGRPLLNRPPLIRTPSTPTLQPTLRPLMSGIPPKPNTSRFNSPATHVGRGGPLGIRMSMKRKTSENIFGIDNPSKQAKLHTDNSSGLQNTMAQNQAAKKDSWETLPIAQKPLSQLMMDYGEQWF